MKKLMTAVLCMLVLCIAFYACKTNPEPKTRIVFASYNPNFPPPPGTKDVFELAQDFPDTFSTKDTYPWASIDFKKDYKAYLQAVLGYCLEGNTEVDFKVQDNKVRKWYNAPWLHYGENGREYHHGLTRERPVPAHELCPLTQDVGLENWAIGFYNQPGGYTIGKVWESGDTPESKLAGFPENTVSFKLLFTAGTAKQVPFLAGSKEWTANIYPCNPDAKGSTCGNKRVDSTVRLLQIDVAIKDKRAGETGWVFGTFIYDDSLPGKTVWERMNPVGVMWGDDSRIDTMIHRPGAFINPYLKETVLNAELIQQKEMADGKKAFMSHHGLGGRLNGPVDNPISSCISCHSKSAVTDKGSPAPMANFALRRDSFPVSQFYKYFAEVKGGGGKWVFDTTTYNKLDYSLQLSAGIRNYYQSLIDSTRAHDKSLAPELKDLPEVTRDGLKQKN